MQDLLPRGRRAFASRSPALAGALVAVAMSSSLVLAACGGGGDDNEVVCVGGCPAQGVTAVDDAQKAQLLASFVADASVAALPSGTLAGKVVSGRSGTATFTGRANHANPSCGTDCVSSTNDTDVTIAFSAFHVAVGATDDVTLGGSMHLTDNRVARTTKNGTTFSGQVSLQATSLAASHHIASSDGRTWGEDDTVTITLTSPDGSAWHGTLRTQAGTSYAF